MSGDLDCDVSGLLPFEKWDFEATKYATTMSNLALVHGMFEDSVKVVLESLVDQKSKSCAWMFLARMLGFVNRAWRP